MALTKRLVKGSPLTAAEHDANLDHFTGALAGKVDSSDARLTDARAPTAHTQAISTITGLQAALDAKASAASVAALDAEMDSKVSDVDARMTNARAIATGNYGLFAVAAGVASLADVAGLVTAILADATAVRRLTKAIWEDLAAAGAADPETNPTPYLTATPAATTENPYPVGVGFDPSENPFATIADAKAGTPNLVATVDVTEDAAALNATVTWSGAVTLDLAVGPSYDASLTANSTITLFDNMRDGVSFLLRVKNAGSFTLSFVAASGVTVEPLGDLTAATGANRVTTYAGIVLTPTLIQIAKVGSTA